MVRQYGKRSKRPRAERLFAELPQSPIRKPAPQPPTVPAPKVAINEADLVDDLTNLISTINIRDEEEEALDEIFKWEDEAAVEVKQSPPIEAVVLRCRDDADEYVEIEEPPEELQSAESQSVSGSERKDISTLLGDDDSTVLRVLTWDDVCPFGDRVEKMAEASYAEVYRVTTARGVSIIKVIRLESPIKPQTKAQERSGLVDEEPRPIGDLVGELQISEWLTDVPGFVVYKDKYVVQGKAPKTLLETHQAFHRKMKRKDPDRLQFYPSPSRYLEETKFLVVELGDAGTALEDFRLDSTAQLWDIFFLAAIALGRAEDLIWFEVSSSWALT